MVEDVRIEWSIRDVEEALRGVLVLGSDYGDQQRGGIVDMEGLYTLHLTCRHREREKRHEPR
jgi:hypothetical protein